MSSEVAIKIENLSKCYHIYDTPRDRLKQFVFPRVQKMLGFPFQDYYREFWALKNVSFEIKKGETVGIVGKNGSGKSTLLQLICGTLNQTEGGIHANGRIAALLELGSGFNPEFTGRENVYLNGAVLGLSKEEIDARYDEIVSFADIGEFINQPVKMYSSGMMVRLAFSVAVNVNPQILIVDEALAVGDELFQRKCFSRIEAIRMTGATVLFVSHSGSTIVELCDRAILLDSGEKLAEGVPKKIIACYQKMLYVSQDRRAEMREKIRQKNMQEILFQATSAQFDLGGQKSSLDREMDDETIHDSFDSNLKSASAVAYESRGAVIDEPAIYTLNGKKVNNITPGNFYCYRYAVRFERSASNVRFGMMIKTVSGVELGGASSSNRPGISYVSAGSLVNVEFTFACKLNPGVYFLNAGVVGDVDGEELFLHRIVDISMFRVQAREGSLASAFVDFDCNPKILINDSEVLYE